MLPVNFCTSHGNCKSSETPSVDRPVFNGSDPVCNEIMIGSTRLESFSKPCAPPRKSAFQLPISQRSSQPFVGL